MIFALKLYFQKLQTKIEKIHVDFKKSINPFEMKKNEIGFLIITHLFCLAVCLITLLGDYYEK